MAASDACKQMDKTCSEADKKKFGKAFHKMILAGKMAEQGKIKYADKTSARKGAPGGERLLSQVLDAARRGVLKGRHFPNGAARAMVLQMRVVATRGGMAAMKLDMVINETSGSSGRNFGSSLKKTRCKPL